MNITILLPLLVCVAGVLLYVLASNPKLQEIGRTMMRYGLLVTLLVLASHVVRF